MKILKVGTLLLLLATAMQAGAQATAPGSGGGKGTKPKNDNCGLLYGKDHALTFCAPKGWTLDNGIMNDQGIYAVFYPSGSNWQKAKDSGTFMYINVVGKSTDATIAKLMADDASSVKSSEPAAVIKQGEPIKIGDHTVPTLQFAPGGFDRYEEVAYVGEGKVLVMFVASSKSAEALNKDYPDFVRLVQSYKFLGSNVTIQQK